MARRFLNYLTVLAVIAGFAYPAHAATDFGKLAGSDGIDLGPVTLHVGLRVAETLDSNIYTKPDSEVDDYIALISPGVLFTVKTQRQKLELGAGADTSMYSENDDENFTATGYKAKYSLRSTSGISFSIDDLYGTSEDPRPEQNVGERKKHFTNKVEGKFGYIFPSKKFSTEFFAKEFHLEYDEVADEGLNRKDREYGVGMYYRVLPKTSLLLEYSHGTKEYIDQVVSLTDSRSNFYRFGIKWDATAKMNGALKIGYEDRTYPEIDYEKSKAPVIDGDVQYKITESTKLKFIARFGIDETAYQGNAGLSNSLTYDHQEVGVGIKSKLLNRITFDITVRAVSDEYEHIDVAKSDSRKDTIHYFDATVTYDFIKNLSAGIGYSVKGKESNDPLQEETTQKVMVFVWYLI